MPIHVDSLLNVQVEIDGKWVVGRPLTGPFIWRLRDAWMVLKGTADAVVFYKQ